MAILKDKRGTILAKGFYDPDSKLAFRVCALQSERLDDALVASRLHRALALRRMLFDGRDTTGKVTPETIVHTRNVRGRISNVGRQLRQLPRLLSTAATAVAAAAAAAAAPADVWLP